MIEDFQFDYKNCNIDVYQLENDEIYHVEVFPDNQTKDSFEEGEFSGVFNSKHLIEGKYTGYEFETILKVPDYFTSEDYKNMFTIIKEELSK
jgi:hypothetical protein